MRLWRAAAFVGLLIVVLLCQTGFVFAEQQYNAFENRWETAPERYDLNYNAFENEWSYQAPEADLQYNAFENRWDWNPEPLLIQPYPCEVEYDLYHRGKSY